MTSPAAAAADDRLRLSRYTQLWFWVVIAIVAGVVFGLVAPASAEKAKWLAEAFIQVIQAVTGPVIFVTVVIGIASIGNLARAGGLALRALAYFFGMTIVALGLGLLVGNIVGAGQRLQRLARRRGAGRRGGADQRGRRRRGGRAGRLHHRQPAAGLVRRAVRRERDPAHPGARHRRRGRDLVPRRPRARTRRRGRRGARPDHLRRHPPDHVGGADRRIRRHGLHGRGLRLRVAREPRPADGHVLGDVRVLRVRDAGAEAIAVGIALVVGIDRIMSEGRALTNCIGNGVATMVIAGWQGERDNERFGQVLREPWIVEEATDRALRGEDVHAGERFGGRFEREPERETPQVVLPGR